MYKRPKPIKISFKPLSKALNPLSQKSFLKRGLSHGALIKDWAHIVGPQWAGKVYPLKIQFPRAGNGNFKRTEGTLYLHVLSGAAVLFQHIEPAVIERVNTHLGYGAVSRLKMIQVPALPCVKKNFTAPIQHDLSKNNKNAPETTLQNIEDPDLNASLQALGNALKNRA